MADLTDAHWRKSTRSGGNGGECVEVADNLPGIVAVRDSKDPHGPTLAFPSAAWATFVQATGTLR
ncbi:DUF397 domain-containing protein [Micromonospora sp. WMMD961]|uniref:DUF397 domain-containing protein n=1 Tax=Micromonospora sp. WMMD961 TaxID=3016100 RepID=UPI0024169E23|nr:DUF397 domain-containing protein [Micromonospora sp. WMMD961]MDG4779588.1 DUF397 domain-containing protein [Micromonospora sp. WMMD961]